MPSTDREGTADSMWNDVSIVSGILPRVTGPMRHIVCALLLLVYTASSNATSVTGTITDLENGEPISLVTVMVEGIGRSMPCNDVGEYRLLLKPGSYRLKFSHVTHYSEWVEFEVPDTAIVLDVALRPAVVPVMGITVHSGGYDPAQRIILQAIANKKALLSQLHSYRCNAYTRSTAVDPDKSGEESIMGIEETQLQCFWEQPDKYKEIIVARQQTSNVNPEQNLVTIEQIPNFNMNRIPYGPYSIISPTAEDALKYYDYTLLDTVFMDGHPVFRLEFEPKNETDPLVRGTVDVADSTFAVVGIDGFLGKGIHLPFVTDFHYSQKFGEFEGKYWMPTEIRLTLTEKIEFPVKQRADEEYVTALYDYVFDPALPSGCFDYVLEVSEDADDVDSAAWYANQLIPLTPLEKTAYRRIDSVTSIPPSLFKRLGNGAWWLGMLSFNHDVFHFNRVEGAYLGYGNYFFHVVPRTDVDLKVGYSFSLEYWQHRFGVNYELPHLPQLGVGIQFRNEFRHRRTIPASSGVNPTLLNLFAEVAPFDYYLERGYRVHLLVKPLNKARIFLMYQDFKQSSEVKNTDYNILKRDATYRLNPAIDDGRLRSFSAAFEFDTINRLKIKGIEAYQLSSSAATILNMEFEFASPDLIDNDFDFLRYELSLVSVGHTILPGLTTFQIALGGSSRLLPPQKHFNMGFSYDLVGEGMSFKTLGSGRFAGDRVAAGYLSHNFGTWLFGKSGLPLIKKIPFSLSIFGGAFWTDFRDDARPSHDESTQCAQRAYSEIGFSLGRIPPLFGRVTFAWQLSDYNANHFAFTFGFGM